MVTIQTEDFDPGTLIQTLEQGRPAIGAVCTFTGLARDYGDQTGIQRLVLEHYPGMTESAIESIIEEARNRWPLQAVTVVHRVGSLAPGERIVFVGTTSAHRKAAFEACQFVMDYLKTQAPFWKKEVTDEGEHWVEQKASDRAAARQWQSSNPD